MIDLSPSKQDSTFEFEKRRNIPVRYNRDLVQTTVKAMQRIGEIQARREKAFFNNRYLSMTITTYHAFHCLLSI